MTEAQDLSHFVRHPADGVAAMDLVVNGVYCGACIVDDREGARQGGGRARRAGQSRQPARDRRMERGRARAAGHPRAARGARLSRPFRSPPRRADSVELLEEKRLLRSPRRRGLRRDERHAAVGLAVGRRRERSQRPTRDLFHWLSALVALPCAAYAGMPFFESARAALGRRAQHGRADLARRHPGSGDVGRCRRCHATSAAPITKAP